MKLKILELFAGTRSIGKAFEAAEHEVFSVDYDERFENIDYRGNVLTLTAPYIIKEFGLPDVIWASFDCTTYSIAAISHHRRKNPETGNLDPVSDYAKECDRTNQYVLGLVAELNRERENRGMPGLLYFYENPRCGLRKQIWMQDKPRYTVTYCQYELDKPMSQTNGHLDESSKPAV